MLLLALMTRSSNESNSCKKRKCVWVSLNRLDTLIHESDEKLSREEHSDVNNLLMQFRLKVHSMMDDGIKAISKLNKKLL